MAIIILNTNQFSNNQACRYLGAWRVFGADPYLDAEDYPTNYILNKTGGAGACCYVHFVDLPFPMNVVSITLHVIHRIEVGFAYFIDIWDGAWQNVWADTDGNTGGAWVDQEFDVTAYLDTNTKINDAYIRLDHATSGGDGIYVDHCYLEIEYGIPPSAITQNPYMSTCSDTNINFERVLEWEESRLRRVKRKRVVGKCDPTVESEHFVTMPRKITITCRMNSAEKKQIWDAFRECCWMPLYDIGASFADYVWLEEPSFRWDTGLGCDDEGRPFIATLGLICSNS